MKITKRQLRKIISEAINLNEQRWDEDEFLDYFDEPSDPDPYYQDDEDEDDGDWDDPPNERRPLLPGNRNSSW
jgi:hypothetical protein